MASAWHRLRRRNRPGSIPARLPDGTGGLVSKLKEPAVSSGPIAALDQGQEPEQPSAALDQFG